MADRLVETLRRELPIPVSALSMLEGFPRDITVISLKERDDESKEQSELPVRQRNFGVVNPEHVALAGAPAA